MGEELKVCVATSRKWKGEDIAREITEKIKKDTPEPKFILLFSTIHHKNEFKPMLKGIKKEFPDAPLVGGTVAGFMNQDGVFTRGVTAMAVQDPEMQVAVGVGKNVKRNPRKAARQAIKEIKKKVVRPTQRAVLINIISGPTLPGTNLFGRFKIVPKRYASLILNATRLTTVVNQIGLGREHEVLVEISKEFLESPLIGLSTNDDNQYLEHYQFYNTTILNNSVLLLYLDNAVKKDVFIKSVSGLKKIAEPSKVDKPCMWGYIIKKLDGKPALRVFEEKLKIIKGVINVKNIHRITPFLPVGCYHKDGTLHPYPVAAFLGESLLVGHSLVGDQLHFLQASGTELIKVALDTINLVSFEPRLLFISSCAARLETLGRHTYEIWDHLKDRPFLLTYGLGEEIKEPGKMGHHLQETFNVLAI